MINLVAYFHSIGFQMAHQPAGRPVPQRLEIPFASIMRGNMIGVGGCGAVYRGTLTDTKDEVAIKELTGPEAMKSCREECSKHMLLHHSKILHIFGVSEDPEHCHAYIITELAPRGSLAGALKSHPLRNDWATMVRWALDIAQGLYYLHNLSHPRLASGPQAAKRAAI